MCCWLKNGGTIENRSGEVACGMKPKVEAAAGTVPQSGFAGVVATLGGSQFDNFNLRGLSEGGAPAIPCSKKEPHVGQALVYTPCDYPGTIREWHISDGSQLVLATNKKLCMGSGDGSVQLVACSDNNSLIYDSSTGRLSATHSQEECLTAGSKTHDAHAQVTLTACGPIPDNSQQFAISLGSVRAKSGGCVAGPATDYRDCCLALCN